jgi:hypothetical protein
MIDPRIAVATANTIATIATTVVITKSIIIVMLITTHQRHKQFHQQVQLYYIINHITHYYSALASFFHRQHQRCYHSYYSHTFLALIDRIAGYAIAACTG